MHKKMPRLFCSAVGIGMRSGLMCFAVAMIVLSCLPFGSTQSCNVQSIARSCGVVPEPCPTAASSSHFTYHSYNVNKGSSRSTWLSDGGNGPSWVYIDVLWPRRITAIGVESWDPNYLSGAIYKVGNNANCDNPYAGDYIKPDVTPSIGWTTVDAVGRYVCIARTTDMRVDEMYIQACTCFPGMYGPDCTCNPGQTGPNHGPCVQCAAAKYKSESGSAACSDCPLNSSSAIGSDKITSCTCNAGWAGENGGQCEPLPCEHGYSGAPGYCTACRPGTYHAHPENTTCLDCARGKHSSAEASTACQDCVAGKYKIGKDARPCVSCVAGTYSETVGSTSNETCKTCPVGAMSLEASVEVTDCVCDAITPGKNGGPCVMCTAGKYTGDPAAENGCLSCPSFSDSPAGSTAVVQCTCNVGSTGSDGNPCILCPSGKHKTTTGSAECTSCLPGEYSKEIGAAENLCAKCPSDSDAPNHTTCVCNAGFTGEDDNHCMACPAGTYKSETGSALCSPCPAGSYNNASQRTTCTSCPAYSNAPSRSIHVTNCTCNPGATGPNGGTACVPCEIGTYKTLAGPAACTLCDTGKFSASTGAIANECACNPGSSGEDGVAECTACGAGTFKVAPGDAACTSCGLGAHSTLLAATENLCTCNAGFTGPDAGLCTACSANTYKDARGTAACTHCQIYSESLAQSVSVDQCICEGGFIPEHRGNGLMECVCETPLENVVLACGAGFDSACAFHVTNTVSLSSWNPAYALDNDYTTMYGAEQIQDERYAYIEFDLGITRNVMAIRTTIREKDRLMITGNEIRVGDASGCSGVMYGRSIATSSPTGPVAVSRGRGRYVCIHTKTNNVDAQNQPFFGMSEVNVLACVPFFCPSPCTTCPRGKFSTDIGDFPCQTCPLNSNAPEGSVDQTACTCKPGSTGPDGTPCVLCGPGKYKPSTGDSACTLCLAGQYSEIVGGLHANVCQECPTNTTSLPGSVTLPDCICRAGWTRQNGARCVLCEAGKYKNATGDGACSLCLPDQYLGTTGASTATACQQCPANSKSLAGTTKITACLCLPGTTGQNGSLCVLCEAGKYKMDTGVSACTLCLPDQYSGTVGASASDTCQNCSSNSASVEGSVARTACVCIPGTYTVLQECHPCAAGKFSQESSANVCQPCPVATFSNTTTSTICTNCSTGRTSALASISVSACQCLPGSVDNGTATCHACGAGSYSQLGDTVCKALSETIRLHVGSNTNVSFQLRRLQPCTVRFLLRSVSNWTIGDRIEVRYNTRRTLNPVILRFTGNSTPQNRHWSPANIEPVHGSNNIYTMTIQKGPLRLRLATYENT